MKNTRILLLTALCAALTAACDRGVERVDLQKCSASEACDNSDQVCVNHYCVDRCREDKDCLLNLVCSDEGICVDKNSGKIPPLVSDCSEQNPCETDKICVSGQCVECSEENACTTGKKCESGICVIDPDYQGSKCLENTDCPADQICESESCVPKCTSNEQCEGANMICNDEGRCIGACHSGTCGEGMVCEGGSRICVPGECSWYDDCEKGYVCDEANHLCLVRCTEGSCAAGTVCDEEGFCVVGECSRIDKTCSDPNKACDRDAMKCVDKCASNADCETGKLCDVTGLCVEPCTAGSCDEGYACMPTGLCIEAECSVIDACDISYKTCVENHCVDKCKKDADCDDDKVCNTDTGVCDNRCTADSCGAGQVCGDDGFCITGTCSKLSPCADGLVCSADYQCVKQGKLYNECYYYRECDNCEEEYDACMSECNDASATLAADLEDCKTRRNNCTSDYATCEAEKVSCDNDAQEDFENLNSKCEVAKTCDPLRTALNATTASCKSDLDKCTGSDCQTKYNNCVASSQKAFDDAGCNNSRCVNEFNTCEKGRIECEARNKMCPEGKQCNAYNQCVDSATAGGLGLGKMCDDGKGNVQKCGEGLSCITRSTDKVGFCKSSAFEHDRKTCSPGAFKDRCEGNVILECDDETGLVFVQDCKTSYIDYSTPTTGKFYGDDFYCLSRPNSNYVACAQSCDTVGDEKYICGWDIDDTDIDYSDRYVCKVNSDGIKAYFPIDSEVCNATCDYYSGKCE